MKPKHRLLRDVPGLAWSLTKLWAAALLDAVAYFLRSVLFPWTGPVAAQIILVDLRLAWAATKLAAVVVAGAVR